MNLKNVLAIMQMALDAAPSEVALVHNIIQTKKTGGVLGLMGSIVAAAPEELALVATFIAAVHGNNQAAVPPVVQQLQNAPVASAPVPATEAPAADVTYKKTM